MSVQTKSLKNNLILKIVNIFNDNNDKLILHERSHEVLKKMSVVDFVYEIIESNLLDKNFLKREWSIFDIPSLKIFENEKFDLKYNIFLPNKCHSTNNAGYMIHSHLSSVLSSYVFYGHGYHSIIFDRDVKYFNDNYAQLKIKRDFFHSKGDINIIDSYEPHLVFNVSEPTYTLVLWSDDKEDPNVSKSFFDKLINKKSSNTKTKLLRNFYVNENRIKSISDNDFMLFMNKVHNNSLIKNNYHVHAICYFIQSIGYTNFSFLEEICSDSNTPLIWKKWLDKLINKKSINYPIFKNESNFLNGSFTYDDIISIC